MTFGVLEHPIDLLNSIVLEVHDMELVWHKCEGDVWCQLRNLDLDHPHFYNLFGVYVIWHSGENPWTVYVGQGAVADRLAEHRTNNAILAYSHLGLFVTWALVDSQYQDGVERYLADTLAPKVGSRHPDCPPLPVNGPWQRLRLEFAVVKTEGDSWDVVTHKNPKIKIYETTGHELDRIREGYKLVGQDLTYFVTLLSILVTSIVSWAISNKENPV